MRDYEPEDCAHCGTPINFMEPVEPISGGAVHKKCVSDYTE